jgi:hypothetical protein
MRKNSTATLCSELVRLLNLLSVEEEGGETAGELGELAFKLLELLVLVLYTSQPSCSC